jgi:CubicO group peptidase (beta-lactamase class C family)
MESKNLFLKKIAFALFVVCTFSCTRPTGKIYPDDFWLRYETPEEAGWSSGLLAEAKVYSDSLEVASIMIVYDGAVVDAWGDIERRFMCHSVRKSFISGLFGIHVGTGEIKIEETLEALKIDDKDSLTLEEKQATVADLLKARSGIYHPAAYETQSMKDRRPKRGSHPHGTFYYYNNWDFNVLAKIFEIKTGLDVFTAFHKEIAEPLKMNDFRVEDTYFHLEPEHSIYPAYPFRMSTRDAARFGLLYLRDGKWKDKQIISREWVTNSRYPWSINVRKDRGYGYLWWIAEDPEMQEYGMYTAAGVGGQYISVFPEADLIIVQRVNTYIGNEVSYDQTIRLYKMILDAKTYKPKRKPVLVELEEKDRQEFTFDLPEKKIEMLKGSYTQDDEEYLVLTNDKGDLLIKTSDGQKFFMLPVSDSEFLLDDIELKLFCSYSPEGEVNNLILEMRDTSFIFLPE